MTANYSRGVVQKLIMSRNLLIFYY